MTVSPMARLGGDGAAVPAVSPYNGLARANGMSPRVVPSEDNENGYIAWHRDKPPCDGWPLPNYRVVKMFVSFWDLPADGGATAVVPGSHRLPEGPSQTLSRGFSSGGRTDAERSKQNLLHHSQMPNHFVAALPAGGQGTAFPLCSHCWLPSLETVPFVAVCRSS